MGVKHILVLGSVVLVAFTASVLACKGGDSGGVVPGDAGTSNASEAEAGSGSDPGRPEESHADIGIGTGGGDGGGSYTNFGPCGPPDSGFVTCFTRTADAVSMGCRPFADCTGEAFACGKAIDCADPTAGKCCAEQTGAKIVATCGEDCAGRVQLCETNDECGAGGTCNDYNCPDTVVRRLKACAPPTGCVPR